MSKLPSPAIVCSTLGGITRSRGLRLARLLSCAPIPNAFILTCPTPSRGVAFPAPDDGVLWRPRVPIRTVSSSVLGPPIRGSGLHLVASAHVDLLGYRFKVRGVDTCAVAAEVIQLEPRRNGADKPSVG